MGDGIRIFERGELAVFSADYAARPAESEGNPAANFLTETSTETGWTTRLDELYQRDGQLAYAYRALFAQDEGATAPALGRGDRGPRVRDLQETLVRLGHLSSAAMATGPGIFGRQTENAVRRFQAEHGIRQTGALGPLDLSRAAHGRAARRGRRRPSSERRHT